MSDYDTGEVLLAISEAGDVAEAVALTTLEAAGLLERQHLQEWVIAHPEVLGPGVKVVAVEFDGFVSAGTPLRLRLDILGLGTDGRLVVAELKRGYVPDTVDMQVIQYAAMVSRFDAETLATVYASFSTSRGTPLTPDQASQALFAHATIITEETLANPRVAVVAQGFSPAVVSSVVWLAMRGVDFSLVRYQPYRHTSGQVFVTFSTLYPLPDLEKSLVGPGDAFARGDPESLPDIEWSDDDFLELAPVANRVTLTMLELCSAEPGRLVSLAEIVETSGVTHASARAQLAGLTIQSERRLGRRNWPVTVQWDTDGTKRVCYVMGEDTAAAYHRAVAQLAAEQETVEGSDPSSTGDSDAR